VVPLQQPILRFPSSSCPFVSLSGQFSRFCLIAKKSPERIVPGTNLVRRFGKILSFGELEAPSSTALSIFLTFLHSAIPGQKPAAAERHFQRLIILGQALAPTP
jgi:hypothetical protein